MASGRLEGDATVNMEDEQRKKTVSESVIQWHHACKRSLPTAGQPGYESNDGCLIMK